VVSIAEQLKRSTSSRGVAVAAAAFCFLGVLGGLAAIAGWHQVVDIFEYPASWRGSARISVYLTGSSDGVVTIAA
jgi:hypothetical protein